MTDFNKLIQEKYISSGKAYGGDINKDNTKTSDSFFKSPSYKLIISLFKKAIAKFENGENKDYYKHVYLTLGDYSKRKGYEGNIYVNMREQALYIKDYVNEHSAAKYTILGVYADLWDILENEKWKIAFKRAFTYEKSSKNENSIVDGFRLLYVSLVLAFEYISFRIVDFKYALYSGLSDEAAINDIQNKNKALMKNIVIPSIDIITLCNNVSTPLITINSLIKEEENGLKSTESYDPTKSEEAFGNTIGTLFNMFKSSKVGTTITTGVKNAGSFAFKKHPWIGIVALSVIFIVVAFHASRSIIYFIGIHKVNLEKELELQSELIGNNINELKNKMQKASSEEEKARYSNIIAKQLEIKNKVDSKLSKMENDDIQASISVDATMEKDLDSTDAEITSQTTSNFELEF